MNKNKIGLFLDDDSRGLERGIILAKINANTKALSLFNDPTIDWIHVKTFDEFVSWLSTNELPYIISFDNDLGETLEGIDCAKWLSKFCISTKQKVPLFIVHSQNNVVNKRIYDELNDTIKYETTYLHQ